METIITLVFHKRRLRHKDLSSYVTWQSQDLDLHTLTLEPEPLTSRQCPTWRKQRGRAVPPGMEVTSTGWREPAEGIWFRLVPSAAVGAPSSSLTQVIPTQGLSALSPSGPQNLPLGFHLHDVLGIASGLVKSLAFGFRKAKFKAILWDSSKFPHLWDAPPSYVVPSPVNSCPLLSFCLLFCLGLLFIYLFSVLLCFFSSSILNSFFKINETVFQPGLSFYTLTVPLSLFPTSPLPPSFPSSLQPCRCCLPQPHTWHSATPWTALGARQARAINIMELARPPPQGSPCSHSLSPTGPASPAPFPVLRRREPRVKGTLIFLQGPLPSLFLLQSLLPAPGPLERVFLAQVGLSPSLSSVQSLSCVWLFATPWTAAHQASLSITNSWSWLKLMSIESMMPSNHLILCRPLLLPPSIFPSIRVFSDESVLWIRWPKYWSFSSSIIPSNEYSGLISFRLDWLDLLAVQGILKSFLQHHSSKASILWCSAPSLTNTNLLTRIINGTNR